jgi:hypothetical protein
MSNGLVPRDLAVTNFGLKQTLSGCRESRIRVPLINACAIAVTDLEVTNINGVPTNGGGGGTTALRFIPDGDLLPVTPTTTGDVQVDGQSGIVSYGLTTPSNTLTIRDLRNLSPYVVGPDPTDSEYQTVTAALAAANASGAPSNILLKQGTYATEGILLAAIPQVFTAVGRLTSIISNSTITQTLNDSVIWENVVFLNTVFTLSQGISLYYNCRFLNCTILANNHSPNFFGCTTQGGSISITGANALDFQNSAFGTPMSIDASGFNIGPLSCIFSDFTYSNNITRDIFENCTFRQTAVTLTNLQPPCAFAQCQFINITTTVNGPGVISFANCLFQGGQVTCVPNPALGVFFVRSSVVSTTFAPFVTGVQVQFLYSTLDIQNTIEFQGAPFVDFQTMRYCLVSNANPAGGALIRINGAAAGIRTAHCTFDGDAGGGVAAVLFDFVAGASIVLYSASLICNQPEYATGTGTIIRPATVDSLGNPQGTNLINGPGNVDPGVTVTDAINPWTSPPYRMV